MARIPRDDFLRTTLAIALFALLYLPFANKPVHIDDANYLMLAEGAARDPWRPHAIPINWNGITEPAFSILSNPPGVAWYLVPMRNQPEWVLHLWMLPWLAVAAWGCGRLGQEFTEAGGYLSALFLLTSPVIVISAHALTPDLPLFACVTAGVGGFVTARRVRWPFALLAGSAEIFRYSGGLVIPLLMLIGWRRWGWRGLAVAMVSAVPTLALVLHDLHAYGQIHLLVMLGWQNDPEHKSWLTAIDTAISGVAMLGGAVVLPVLIWRRQAVVGALLGAAIGLDAAFLTGQRLGQAIPTMLFTAGGMAALSLAIAPRIRHPVLSSWAVAGALFFLVTRFAATRYWVPFMPGVALLALRNAGSRTRLQSVGIAANVLLSLGIAIDDQNFARAHKAAAQQVAQFGTGTFSGHWGWQHYLQAAGWSPVERGGPTASWHAYARSADSQLPDPAICLEFVERWQMQDKWWGPRVYSPYGRAFYHGGGVGWYAPWTLSDEPYEVITLYQMCDDSPGASGARDVDVDQQ